MLKFPYVWQHVLCTWCVLCYRSSYSAGFMVHNVYGAVVGMTYRDWADGAVDAGDEPDEDARLQVQKKAWRTKCYAGELARQQAAAVLLFVSVPLDHVWRQVQHLEHSGSVLQDLCVKRLNYFEVACCKYYKMASVPIAGGSLQALVWHFAPQGQPRLALVTEVRKMILHQASHLCWRLVVPFSSFPFKLLGMVDSRFSEEERFAVAKEFFDTPMCDLDPDFSEKLRRMYASAGEMFSCCDLQFTLIEWGLSSGITNMPLERQLALIKKATPGHAPSLERYCAAGYMTQLLAAHRASGRSDPRMHKTSDLLAEGAPLQAACSTVRNACMVRPGLLYSNDKMQALRRELQESARPEKVPRHEYRQKLKTWSTEFALLPPAEKVLYHARAQAIALHPEIEHEKPARLAEKGCIFFGQWSKDFPLDPECVKQAFLKYLELDDCPMDETPGVTVGGMKVRDDALKSMFVKDAGAIPANQKFEYSTTCWLKNRGLCRSRDATIWGALTSCATSLHAAFEESEWYTIFSERTDADGPLQKLFVFVAYMRGAGPKIVVCVMAEALSFPADCLRLVCLDKCFVFKTAGMLSRDLMPLDKASLPDQCVHSISAQKLLVESVPSRFDEVRVVEHLDVWVVHERKGVQKVPQKAKIGKAGPVPENDPKVRFFELGLQGLFSAPAVQPRKFGSSSGSRCQAMPISSEAEALVFPLPLPLPMPQADEDDGDLECEGSENDWADEEHDAVEDIVLPKPADLSVRSGSRVSPSSSGAVVAFSSGSGVASSSGQGSGGRAPDVDMFVVPVPPPPSDGEDGGVARKRLQVTQKFETPSHHFIRWDAIQKSFGAHCSQHSFGSKRCKFDRMGTKAPVAHMLAWLELSLSFDTREDHQRAKTDHSVLTLQVRREWRTWAQEHIPEAIEIEKLQRKDGENSEPECFG